MTSLPCVSLHSPKASCGVMSKSLDVRIIPDGAIVRGKDDHGVGGELLRFQSLQDFAYLGIHHAAKLPIHARASSSLEFT